MCRACSEDPVLAFRCRAGREEHLHKLYLFDSLSHQQIHEVAERMAEHELEVDQWVYHQGDAAERFYLVLEGHVGLLRQSATGEEVIVAIVGPGETFAEDMILGEDPVHQVSSRALDPCQLASFDRAHFSGFLEESPALVRKLMGTLQRRNELLLDEIEQLALQSATERLSAYLLKESRRIPDSPRVSLSFPKRVLAARLSIKPETLSRILARLKECKFIEVDGQEIILPKPENLRAGMQCYQCINRFWGCPAQGMPGPEVDRETEFTNLGVWLANR